MNLSQHAGRLILPLFALLALSFFSACEKDEIEMSQDYLPEIGHLSISFTHNFNPADYEEGKRIVIEEFSYVASAIFPSRALPGRKIASNN